MHTVWWFTTFSVWTMIFLEIISVACADAVSTSPYINYDVEKHDYILMNMHTACAVLCSGVTETRSWLYVQWWRHQMETFSASLALCAENSPVTGESPHKGQWRGALMFSLICALINGWVNNLEADDLRRHHTHYDVIVMTKLQRSSPKLTAPDVDVRVSSTHWSQDDRHFPDDIFVNENTSISITNTLRFIPSGPISNIPASVQRMALCRPGDTWTPTLSIVSLEWITLGCQLIFICNNILVTIFPHIPSVEFSIDRANIFFCQCRPTIGPGDYYCD